MPHGDLVGPGIRIMAKLQDQDSAPLEAAMKACHIPLDSFPETVIQQTLKGLPAYVRAHNLPYGIAHELGAKLDIIDSKRGGACKLP